MLYHAKNGRVPIDDTHMDYIAFGSGTRPLILIPGLGEGLQEIYGTALPMAVMYRKLARDYRVYAFGRRLKMPGGFTTRDMAEDIYHAMVQLDIPAAGIVGVSLGGMIVQHLAAEHPEKVEKLILCVTLPYKNEALVSCLTRWSDMAEQGDIKGIMIDTLLHSNTPASIKKQLWMYKLLGGLLSKKHMERFRIMAKAGIDHDGTQALGRITCPTLILGGRKDQIVTGEASERLHEMIGHSTLYMYEDYGHGLYEEAPDFLDRVKGFFDQ